MIKRKLSEFLQRWKETSSRRPLILKGARQVGKTTLIKDFGKSYEYFLYFNLELAQDLVLFKNMELGVNPFLQLLFISRNVNLKDGETALIFIDEIQERPEVIEVLRYFYEELPHIHIIVTGSLLEFALDGPINMPVGRVEFAELLPLSFSEYLAAIGKDVLLSSLENATTEQGMVDLLMKEFHTYALIGGMPFIVSEYFRSPDLVRLNELYMAIVEAYKSDVMKYAASANEATIIRKTLSVLPYEIDNRINLSKFANLPFKAVEIKQALQKLESARWIKLKYPSSSTEPPMLLDYNKRPRLHFLDIGLVNFQLGLNTEYLQMKDMHQLSRGRLIQQVVSQEVYAQANYHAKQFTFWVREEKGTTSEVDILYNYRQKLIPIEIKSGATGTLRSLQEFIDRCPHDLAVRLYSGPLSIDRIKTRKGKEFTLLNLPYCLCGMMDKYLNWAEEGE